MRFARTAALTAALAALLVLATAMAAPATDIPGAPRAGPSPCRCATPRPLCPSAMRTAPAMSATKFKHWVDADKDGCTTRAEVLKTETVTAPEQGTSCRLSGDRWYAPYDDRYFTGPSGLDIDHLVPLAEAWDFGALAWPPAEREAYTNDLGDERALIAVSAAWNRSKADQDPTTWLPPATGYRCQYVTDGVADKTRWGPSTELRRGSRPVPGPQPLPQRAGHVTLAR
ncbi:HNH endonuclease family protein [Streptomyces achromogenes]|uniref:HNH endonuclease family protein n=1 Tax=Streptomyces achromogenes TaxID=67255 RepID=UPI0033DB2BFB